MATVVSPPVEGAKERIGMSPVTRRMFYLLGAYVVRCVYLSLAAPNFLTERNLVNILRQMSMIAIIGVGMTMVIIAAEIDLSVGSMAAFSGVLLALLTALRSAAFLLTGGFPISPLPSGFELLGNGAVGPIPVPVILMGLIYF